MNVCESRQAVVAAHVLLGRPLGYAVLEINPPNGTIGWLIECTITDRAIPVTITVPSDLVAGTSLPTSPVVPLSPGLVLTQRQRSILDLLCDGDESKTIAYKLHFSKSTIKREFCRLFDIAGVPNRSALARWYALRIHETSTSPEYGLPSDISSAEGLQL